MKILGVDYGRRKIGLAIAEGKLAEPLRVLRYQDIEILSERIEKIVSEYGIEKIVVGVSEGKMAEETRSFLLTLRSRLSTTPIETFDETLSTKEAQRLAIEAQIGRKKRKALEDAFAAAAMLQNYLDSRRQS